MRAFLSNPQILAFRFPLGGPTRNDRESWVHGCAPRFLTALYLRTNQQRRSLQMDDNDFNPIDLDTRNTVTRRIVEVTDEDETLFPEFIEIDAFEARRQP